MIARLNNLADDWMEALWDSAVQGGVALLAVWCICRFVPRISPAFKMWLWRLAWLKLVVTLFWSGSIQLPLLSTPTPTAVPPATLAPISLEAPARVSPGVSLSPESYLFMIWVFGAVGYVAFLGLQWLRSGRVKRTASAVTNISIMDECLRMRFKKVPALLQSSSVSMPALVGVFRPAIILPTAVVAEAWPARLQMMLGHELAHVKRRDLMWAWLPAICHALFFFHPLLWLTRREWLLAQEVACDELALRRGQAAAVDYGNMLVDLVASRKPKPAFGALSICETSRNLKRRIQAMKIIDIKRSRLLMLVAFIPVATLVLPWQIVAQDKPDDAAKRIEQLEKANAELRQELQRLKGATDDDQLAATIAAMEADLKLLRNKYRDHHPRVLQMEKDLQELKERQKAGKTGKPGSQLTKDVWRGADQPAVNESRRAQEREVEKMYMEELAVAQKYADSMRKQFESGRATQEEFFRAQKQFFELRREMARTSADNPDELRRLLEEEVAIVNKMLKEARKRIEIGVSPVESDLNLQRELLRLRRELIMLE